MLLLRLLQWLPVTAQWRLSVGVVDTVVGVVGSECGWVVSTGMWVALSTY